VERGSERRYLERSVLACDLGGSLVGRWRKKLFGGYGEHCGDIPREDEDIPSRRSGMATGEANVTAMRDKRVMTENCMFVVVYWLELVMKG
jgi:hypothetical protein